MTVFLLWLVCLLAALFALFQAYQFFRQMMASDEGTPRMVEIAGYVREGANAYLNQQFRVVGVFFAVIAVLLAYMSFGLHVQSEWVPFAFLSGGFFSGLAGWFGMKTATWASSRTAAGAREITESRFAGCFPLGSRHGANRGWTRTAGHHNLVRLVEMGHRHAEVWKTSR